MFILVMISIFEVIEYYLYLLIKDLAIINIADTDDQPSDITIQLNDEDESDKKDKIRLCYRSVFRWPILSLLGMYINSIRPNFMHALIYFYNAQNEEYVASFIYRDFFYDSINKPNWIKKRADFEFLEAINV
jgi:hypothetical protein